MLPESEVGLLWDRHVHSALEDSPAQSTHTIWTHGKKDPSMVKRNSLQLSWKIHLLGECKGHQKAHQKGKHGGMATQDDLQENFTPISYPLVCSFFLIWSRDTGANSIPKRFQRLPPLHELFWNIKLKSSIKITLNLLLPICIHLAPGISW